MASSPMDEASSPSSVSAEKRTRSSDPVSTSAPCAGRKAIMDCDVCGKEWLGEDETAKLKTQLKEAIRALWWCSGLDQVQKTGESRVGWMKLCQPILDKDTHD